MGGIEEVPQPLDACIWHLQSLGTVSGLWFFPRCLCHAGPFGLANLDAAPIRNRAGGLDSQDGGVKRLGLALQPAGVLIPAADHKLIALGVQTSPHPANENGEVSAG